ncbi:hypothetical protein DFP72DRAFT_890783 [Ephemerocybe angulata]|uniref:Uncharacterized protein n=1 Tax=Ephemerocybe angulata TaxID=980116 RepID=A0A8H6M9F6_9AGAR|nr:hypothetical protein DFP72DRAFT_890783 [Tulosesus angulatus]
MQATVRIPGPPGSNGFWTATQLPPNHDAMQEWAGFAAVEETELSVVEVLLEKLRDPVTGQLPDLQNAMAAITRFHLENPNDPDIVRLAQMRRARAQSLENTVDFETFDYAGLKVIPVTIWRIGVRHKGIIVDPARPDDWRLHESKKADYPDAIDTYEMTCDIIGYVGDDDFYRYKQEYRGNFPTADEVLLFIKKSMAQPALRFKPALPSSLPLDPLFKPYTPVLEPFLNSLADAVDERYKSTINPGSSTPTLTALEAQFASSSSTADPERKPFHWFWDTQAQADLHESILRNKAIDRYNDAWGKCVENKESGNSAFRRGDKKSAIDLYTKASYWMDRAYREIAPGDDEREKESRELGAILLANRSVAWLTSGSEAEARVKAEEDARLAIRCAPLYAKGHARLAKVYQANGDLVKAKQVLAQALSKPELQDEVGLVDMLIDLQTDEKGLPEDDEEFKLVARRIMYEDEDSAKMVKDVAGLWRERISRVPVQPPEPVPIPEEDVAAAHPLPASPEETVLPLIPEPEDEVIAQDVAAAPSEEASSALDVNVPQPDMLSVAELVPSLESLEVEDTKLSQTPFASFGNVSPAFDDQSKHRSVSEVPPSLN